MCVWHIPSLPLNEPSYRKLLCTSNTGPAEGMGVTAWLCECGSPSK